MRLFSDTFVYEICFDAAKTGFFVNLGTRRIKTENSEYVNLLEQNGWNGLAIDVSMDKLKDRKCVVHSEVIGKKRTISEILKSLNCPKTIDYLSLHLDGIVEFSVLKNIIDSEYEFKVLAFKHDIHSNNQISFQNKKNAYEYLTGKGYIIAIKNASVNSCVKNISDNMPYEDWYINPKYINLEKILNSIQSRSIL